MARAAMASSSASEKTLPQGFDGRVDEDGAGARSDGGAQAVEVEMPVGSVQRNGHGHGAQREHGVPVIAVEGLEEDDLVAGIEQGQRGGVERAGGSGGDENLGFGIGVDAVVGGELGGDGFAQRGDAVEAGVGVEATVDRVDRALGGERRKFGIADALGEIDSADAIALDRHGADLGLEDERRDLAEAALGGGCWHGRTFLARRYCSIDADEV